jgi:hypothetical protein
MVSRLRCNVSLVVKGLRTTLFVTAYAKVKDQDFSSTPQRTTCNVFYNLQDYFRAGSTRVQMDFYVLRDLRATDRVFGLPSLDDEQTSLEFGTVRVSL